MNALNFFDEVSVVPAIEKLTFRYNDLKSTMVFTLFTIKKNIVKLLKSKRKNQLKKIRNNSTVLLSDE